MCLCMYVCALQCVRAPVCTHMNDVVCFCVFVSAVVLKEKRAQFLCFPTSSWTGTQFMNLFSMCVPSCFIKELSPRSAAARPPVLINLFHIPPIQI